MYMNLNLILYLNLYMNMNLILILYLITVVIKKGAMRARPSKIENHEIKKMYRTF